MSISTPVALAAEYRASMHAAIRYYVLGHPDPVSVLVAGRYVNSKASVPVFESVDSPSFLERFGALAPRMNGELMIGNGPGRPLGDIAKKALSGGEVAEKEVLVRDITGGQCAFAAEAFFNQHNLFVMLTERKAARLGRRIRAAAS